LMAGREHEGLVYTDADWMNQATCRVEKVNTNIFFVERGSRDAFLTAKMICDRCPVQTECCDYAVANGIQHGLWGKGTRERRQMKPTFERELSVVARRRMVWLYEHGWTQEEIAREFRVGRKTVLRHIAMERAS
jgi:WhiB family redox-sensing transcriptional regulator